MRRWAAAALALALLAPCAAGAQSVYSVVDGKSISVQVAGATSAYPVNPDVAEAGIVDGVVRIRGVGAGITSVVVVTATSSETLTVTVTAPQLALSLGVLGENDAARGTLEGGSYDGGYSSAAGQFTNAIEFHQQQGDSFRRLTMVTSTYTTPGQGQGTGFPFLSYEVGRPGYDIVFLDEAVSTSPLTFEDALVRGIHFQEGRWVLHAGVSSVAAFGPFFIPTNPQWMMGATRIFKISRDSDLAANFYDIINAKGNDVPVNGGLIGSLLYTYHPAEHLLLQAEVGVSHGIGFAGSATYDDSVQHLDAAFLDKPQAFASLASDPQQGLFGNVDYTRTISEALSFNGGAQQSDFDAPSFRENSLSTQGNVNYRLSKSVTLNAGMLYSSFQSFAPTTFGAKTLALPIGIQYGSGRYTAGLFFQPTTDFSGTLANAYGANAGMTYGPFQVAGFYRHDVDIPTISSIFSEVPGLQAALEQAGIDVTDPAQLAAVLNNAALLASLGFTGLRFNIAPARNDVGLNANWSGSHRSQQVTFSFLSSNAQLNQGAFNFQLATLTYQRRLSSSNTIEPSVSLLKTVEREGATTSQSSVPSYGVTFQHRFDSAPAFLFPTKRGTIDGYVFHDDDSTGAYKSSDAGLAAVIVTLDGGRTARTDADGHYSFASVPFGTHQVAAQLSGDKPSYFTTASPATAEIGRSVNFGVNYVEGKIFGYVTNDAGAGIPGVVVRIEGSSKNATSEDDGRFVLDGVARGNYVVTASLDSFPAGYDLSTFKPVSVSVNTAAPWPVALSARALRSVSGTLTIFDTKKQRLVPAAGVNVSIRRLGLTVKTEQNGAYALRDLPSGVFVVQTGGGSAAERQTISLSADPTNLTDIDFRVTTRSTPMSRSSRRPSTRSSII